MVLSNRNIWNITIAGATPTISPFLSSVHIRNMNFLSLKQQAGENISQNSVSADREAATEFIANTAYSHTA